MASSTRCSMKSTSSPRSPAARSRPPTTRCSARKPSRATRRGSSITTRSRISGTRCSSPRAGRASPRPLVSRSDLEVEYFDQELFNGATVYDVMTRSPRVIVTATDLVRAKPFAFTREQLNGICVDPKTRAGGARGVRFGGDAYLFRAAGDAHLRGSMRLPAARQHRRRDARRRTTSTDKSAPSACSRSSTAKIPVPAPGRRRASRTTSARAPSSTKWRWATPSPTRCAATASRVRAACCSSWSTRAPASTRRYAQQPEPIGIKKVMDAVVSATFNRYSSETMNLMRAAREEAGRPTCAARAARWRWRSRIATSSTSTSSNSSFERVKDPEEREYLDRVPDRVHAVVRADHPAAPRRTPAGR